HPMDVLRTAVSALSTFDTYGRNDNSLEATLERGIRLISQMPTIVMSHYNIHKELDPIEPSETLAHAANFLYMMNGKAPSSDTVRLMDQDFIVHADHDVNASSFTARVVAGTNANLYDAVTAAIAALAGPAHGGAAEDVMKMVEEIGKSENATAYIQGVLDGRLHVTGFGHRVYKTKDPRASHLEKSVQKLSQEAEDQTWYEILKAVQEKMEPLQTRGIYPNVDFFAGVAYYLMGFKPDMFVPIFAVGRIPGWTAQFIEQTEHNILIRPLSLYVGLPERPYTPIGQRELKI
ncbi:MAG: citrate/2-methylcitrate synthase, partial [Nanoarchaeota archaeon]